MIWAAVIFASAIIKGTEYFSYMFVILAGGAAGSLIVLKNHSDNVERWKKRPAETEQKAKPAD